MEVSHSLSHLAAHYEKERITVYLPEAWVPDWVDSNQVGFEGTQPIEGEDVLTITVEKDFKCLHRPPTQKDADTFPHPLAS